MSSWARLLGEEEAAELLDATLNEEKQADERLTEVAENYVNQEQCGDPDELETADKRRRK